MTITEQQMKQAVGMALRNRDAALNDAITLALENEDLKAQLAAVTAERDKYREALDDLGWAGTP